MDQGVAVQQARVSRCAGPAQELEARLLKPGLNLVLCLHSVSRDSVSVLQRRPRKLCNWCFPLIFFLCWFCILVESRFPSFQMYAWTLEKLTLIHNERGKVTEEEFIGWSLHSCSISCSTSSHSKWVLEPRIEHHFSDTQSSVLTPASREKFCFGFLYRSKIRSYFILVHKLISRVNE